MEELVGEFGGFDDRSEFGRREGFEARDVVLSRLVGHICVVQPTHGFLQLLLLGSWQAVDAVRDKGGTQAGTVRVEGSKPRQMRRRAFRKTLSVKRSMSCFTRELACRILRACVRTFSVNKSMSCCFFDDDG